MMADSNTLQALAGALDVDVDYFFRPFTFDLGMLEVSFRKKSDVGAKEVAALKVQIQDEIERYLEIEEILGNGCPAPKRINSATITTRQDIEQFARQVRQMWGLGKDCIANVQNVLEAHGIKVIFTDAAEGFDGMSGVVNGTHYIIVLNSTKKHIERRRLTAIHELGHLLFNGAFSSELTGREREQLCNAFACELLLPEERIRQYNTVWRHLEETTCKLRRFDILFTPDYSLYVDDFLSHQNREFIYRTRFIGAYWQRCGFGVIPTVSWGNINSFEYAFEGLPTGSVLAVCGTGHETSNASCMLWEYGLRRIEAELAPTTIIIYGREVEVSGLHTPLIFIPDHITKHLRK